MRLCKYKPSQGELSQLYVCGNAFIVLIQLLCDHTLRDSGSADLVASEENYVENAVFYDKGV